MGESNTTILVAAGVLASGGNVLLCRRAEGARYALQWEFPGGKVEHGESPADALRRELSEELGITAQIGQLLWHEETAYPDGGVFAVSFFAVESWEGEIRNRVFDKVEWTSPEGLAERYEILQGNITFCGLLPELLRNTNLAR